MIEQLLLAYRSVGTIQRECYKLVIELLEHHVPVTTVIELVHQSLIETEEEYATSRVVAYSNILLILEKGI